MTDLAQISSYFDELRGKGDGYTEEKIKEVIENSELSKFDNIADVPTRVLSEILQGITDGNCGRLDQNQEQELIDFLESIMVAGTLDMEIIIKAFRYLFRPDNSKKSAFVIVDVQNDFISGSLALRNTPDAQEGAEVVPVINRILDSSEFDMVAYSIDWHPADHCSFVTNVSKYELDESCTAKPEECKIYDHVIYKGLIEPMDQVLWPPHCVQLSEGAKLHEDLKIVPDSHNVYKGQNPRIDSYSAFWDNGKLSRTTLLGLLFDNNITTVFTCGVAYDFCVGMTTYDSNQHGFETVLIEDATRGVSNQGCEDYREKLVNAGVKVIQSDQLSEHL